MTRLWRPDGTVVIWVCGASGAPRAHEVAGVSRSLRPMLSWADLVPAQFWLDSHGSRRGDGRYGKAYCQNNTFGCSWELLAKAMSHFIGLMTVTSLAPLTSLEASL